MADGSDGFAPERYRLQEGASTNRGGGACVRSPPGGTECKFILWDRSRRNRMFGSVGIGCRTTEICASFSSTALDRFRILPTFMDGMRRMPPNRSFEMKKVVVFTGAGVSADSGLSTFRDADGLWADYRIEDVCTPEALARNRRLVIEFYNKRRREMLAARPNAAHLAIAGLEADFDVEVVTQNVDDLHERAGSTRVTHLHGELRKLRSSRDPALVVPIEGWEQPLDATAPDGALLRPHIVFFGEAVPQFDRAARIAAAADVLIVVGTSLAVYPAASLVHYVRPGVPIYLVDPGAPDVRTIRNPLTHLRERAAVGMPELAERLRRESQPE